MKIIEIAAQSNGGHRNMTVANLSYLPVGWAKIPEDMEIPETFPFVDVEAKNGVVTAMTAGTVPDPDPEAEPSEGTGNTEEIEAALDEIIAIQESLIGGAE